MFCHSSLITLRISLTYPMLMFINVCSTLYLQCLLHFFWDQVKIPLFSSSRLIVLCHCLQPMCYSWSAHSSDSEVYILTRNLAISLLRTEVVEVQTFGNVTPPPLQATHGLIKTFCKVKWSRYRPSVAQGVGKGTALLFHDRGTRRGWAVSSTPRPHFTPGKDPVPIV